MALSKRLAHSILLLPIILSGCLSGPFETETASSPGTEASDGGLPPGDFIEFFDGKYRAAAPYEIIDGTVVVDGDIMLGSASELLGRAGGPGGPAGALSKSAGNIETTAMAGQAKHWASGRIPYVIENEPGRKATVEAAIREWNGKAAVIWVPKTSGDADYVAFVDHPSKTSSYVGRIGNRQVLNVQPIAQKRHVMHEMGHASGLYHEHQRSDRASNVNTSSSFLFNAATSPDFGAMGTAVGSYDHTSIMHYEARTYYFIWNTSTSTWEITSGPTQNWILLESQSGKPSILPDTTLSPGDLLTLRSMYMTALPYDQATTKSLTTGLGWPIVRPFMSGGLNFILHYNPADGQFRTYPFSGSQGMINSPVEFGTWNAGWTMIEFYLIGSQTYALFYNKDNGSAQFYTMNSNGKLGSWIEGQGWYTGWDIARVYKPFGAALPYMFLYSKGSGLAHIWGMKSNGALDLGRNTYSQTLFGYEDMQVMEEIPSEYLHPDGKRLMATGTFLLYHDQQSSAQFLQVLDHNGKLGSWAVTSSVGTGFTQVNVYKRSRRSLAMYYNKSTGKLLFCDVLPVFKLPSSGAGTPTFSATTPALRSHTSSANYQVYNFNFPWGVDPKGAERLLLFDPNLKRFWNSNLVPYPSI